VLEVKVNKWSFKIGKNTWSILLNIVGKLITLELVLSSPLPLYLGQNKKIANIENVSSSTILV
jgi:hypothetical protein